MNWKNIVNKVVIQNYVSLVDDSFKIFYNIRKKKTFQL